jgi:3-mercaptopyruvate sulfurtransferase SseA
MWRRVCCLQLRETAMMVLLSVTLLALSRPAFATADLQSQQLAQVQEEARRGNYKLITPGSMRDRFLKNPSSLFLVDTRQDWEYQQEHIQGAVNLPVNPTWWTQYSFSARAGMKKLLGPDKKREVVFY